MFGRPDPRIAQLETDLARERSRTGSLLASLREKDKQLDRLTQALLDLKREGFNPPDRTVVVAREEESLPSEIEAAAAQRAKPGTDLYGELCREAEAMLAAGQEPETVAHSLLQGGVHLFDDD